MKRGIKLYPHQFLSKFDQENLLILKYWDRVKVSFSTIEASLTVRRWDFIFVDIIYSHNKLEQLGYVNIENIEFLKIIPTLTSYGLSAVNHGKLSKYEKIY